MACVIEDVLTTNVLLNRARPKPAGAITIAGTDHYLNRVESNTSLHALSSDGPERIIAAFLIRGANHSSAIASAKFPTSAILSRGFIIALPAAVATAISVRASSSIAS